MRSGLKRAPRRDLAARERITSRLPADPRQALAAAVEQRGASLAALSRMIGRSPSYLQRFIAEGGPAALSAREHRLLADHFGLSERALGVRELWVPLAA